MTARRYARNAVSPCVDTVKHNDSFSYRPAVLKDCARLAELFQTVYGTTTHPCQNPSYIRDSLMSGLQVWYVVELDSILMGCGCIARRPWNQSWEICHGVVHPAARRTGVISNLVKLSLDSHRPQAMELGFYVTRNIASHTLMLKLQPGVLVGHDGGPDTVDGIREYHLTALLPHPVAGLRHIAPWYVRSPGVEMISRHLYQALGFEGKPGAYPATCLSGPASQSSHGQLLYAHDPFNRTLTLSGQTAGYLPQPRALAEIIGLLQQSPELQYVCVQILADKLELLAGLLGLGFTITAYLPAWHLEDGARYDCIQLVLQTFSSRPRSHGFDDQVTFFDLAYAQLAKRLCGLRLAQAHA
jgi:N-acetylglutamate synthase-like GNAT family acetyltransferase